MKFFKQNWAKYLWITGLIQFMVGESVTAFNHSRDDTASETWRDLPEPARFAVFGFLCAVLAHWVWQMPSKVVNIEELNVEIREDA